MNQIKLNEKMADLVNHFKNHEAITTVYLFGSYGSPSYNPDLSDIDLAILFNRNLSLKEELSIDADVSLILESDNYDLINLNKASVSEICIKQPYVNLLQYGLRRQNQHMP